jgi:hypothetical protein
MEIGEAERGEGDERESDDSRGSEDASLLQIVC